MVLQADRFISKDWSSFSLKVTQSETKKKKKKIYLGWNQSMYGWNKSMYVMHYSIITSEIHVLWGFNFPRQDTLLLPQEHNFFENYQTWAQFLPKHEISQNYAVQTWGV